MLLIMCILVYLQSTSVLVDGWSRRPDATSSASCARIVGEDWVYTAEHQLRTYESDGLLQYHVIPAAAVLPGTAEEVQAVVQACAERRRAVGRARRRLRALAAARCRSRTAC